MERLFQSNWSRAQILLRLVELEGDEILQTPLKENSPLRTWEIKVNQASRRKSEVLKLAEEVGLMLTGNKTTEVSCVSRSWRRLP